MTKSFDDLVRRYMTSRTVWTADVAHWLAHELSPRKVLVVGEVAVDLVSALRQHGLDAWGLQLLVPAPSAQPLRETSSSDMTTAPFPDTYDLIVSIEALTGLNTQEAGRAVESLCRQSSTILFAERPPLYGAPDAPERVRWVLRFLRQGFIHDVAFDATPLLPWAVRFQQVSMTQERLVVHYERHLQQLERESAVRRLLNVEQRETLVQVESQLFLLETLQRAVENWEARWAELESGILWPWVQRLQHLRAALAPPGSRRERGLEMLFRKASQFGTTVEVPPVTLPEAVRSHKEPVDLVLEVRHGLQMTQRCLEAIAHYTAQPYLLTVVLSEKVDAETRSFIRMWVTEYEARLRSTPILESDATYIVRLDTSVVVTPKWLDYLISCAERGEGLSAVVPLSNLWVSLPNAEHHTLGGMAELVARAAGGLCLPISKRPKGCALFPSASEDRSDQRAVVSDRAYVHYQDTSGVTPALPNTEVSSPEGRVWLGAQARLGVARERLVCLERGRADFGDRRVLFILPVSTPGGGANVVISEGLAMREMGVEVEIFNLIENRRGFETAYPDLEIPVLYGSPQLLVNQAVKYDAVVATFNTSVQWLAPLMEGEVVRGYYIQDFEPYLYKAGTLESDAALASYTLFPHLVRFTKTDWTRRKVLQETGGDSTVVGPSVELDLFRPRDVKPPPLAEGPLRIGAMIRPFSPYRASELTMQILRKAKRRYGDAVEVYLFGTSANSPGFVALPHDFEWKLAGVLEKCQVAHLLAMTDLFVDFSTHQAMGLTAMEAMACANAVIVPQQGGAKSFACHEHNALIVDTSSEKACWRGLQRLIENQDLREHLRRNGLEEIVRFYPERAAYNILRVIFASDGGVEP